MLPKPIEILVIRRRLIVAEMLAGGSRDERPAIVPSMDVDMTIRVTHRAGAAMMSGGVMKEALMPTSDHGDDKSWSANALRIDVQKNQSAAGRTHVRWFAIIPMAAGSISVEGFNRVHEQVHGVTADVRNALAILRAEGSTVGRALIGSGRSDIIGKGALLRVKQQGLVGEPVGVAMEPAKNPWILWFRSLGLTSSVRDNVLIEIIGVNQPS